MDSESEPVRDNNPTPHAQGEADNQTDQTRPDMPRAASIPPAPPAKAHCEITCKTEKDCWDHVKTGAELLGIVLLAVYTAYTIKMYCANKKAAEAAKQSADTGQSELELSKRPWISAEFSIIGPLTIDNEGAHLTVQVTPDNVGNSPAVKGVEQISMYAAFLTYPDPRQVRQAVCNEAEAASANAQNFRNQHLKTWFVGKQPPEAHRLNISREEIKKAAIDTPRSLFHNLPLKGNVYSIGIAYCVAYFPSFKEVQYHTGYVLDLFRYQKAPPGENLSFQPENAVIRVGLHYDWIAGDGPEAN